MMTRNLEAKLSAGYAVGKGVVLRCATLCSKCTAAQQLPLFVRACPDNALDPTPSYKHDSLTSVAATAAAD